MKTSKDEMSRKTCQNLDDSLHSFQKKSRLMTHKDLKLATLCEYVDLLSLLEREGSLLILSNGVGRSIFLLFTIWL
jgi:hypothetical protein